MHFRKATFEHPRTTLSACHPIGVYVFTAGDGRTSRFRGEVCMLLSHRRATRSSQNAEGRKWRKMLAPKAELSSGLTQSVGIEVGNSSNSTKVPHPIPPKDPIVSRNQKIVCNSLVLLSASLSQSSSPSHLCVSAVQSLLPPVGPICAVSWPQRRLLSRCRFLINVLALSGRRTEVNGRRPELQCHAIGIGCQW